MLVLISMSYTYSARNTIYTNVYDAELSLVAFSRFNEANEKFFYTIRIINKT